MSLISAVSMIVLLCGTSLLFCRTLFRNEINSSIKELDYITSQLDSYILTTENYSKTIISNELVRVVRYWLWKLCTSNGSDGSAVLRIQSDGIEVRCRLYGVQDRPVYLELQVCIVLLLIVIENLGICLNNLI